MKALAAYRLSIYCLPIYRQFMLLALSVALSACALGPDYQRPHLQTPPQFKHIEGWTQATPGDALERGNWWQLYGDAELNALVERLNISNQNLAASEAQYRQARALVSGARAALYPSLSSSAGVSRSSQGSGSTNSSTSNTTRTGGTPYGASHVAGTQGDPEPSHEEAVLARALGRRIAQLAQRLQA